MNKKRRWAVLSGLLFMLMFLCFAPKAYAAPKFNVSEANMKKAIAKYSVRVPVGETEQRFAFKDKEITKIVIKNKSYSAATKTETVKAVVYIDRSVAVVRASVNMKYKYKNGSWKCTSVNIGRGVISQIKLKGTWKGTYVANQGKTGVTIKITRVTSDGYLDKGLFSFYATPTNPKVPSGSYTLKGGYDKSTGAVALYGKEWVSKPSTYFMIDIDAKVDLEKKKIVSDNYQLSISKK